MAAGWPTKVTYANGDVFNASDINDTNGTLNYIDPTSATNNQVITRDSTAPGKVKWAASATSVLTTTGDVLYASAPNTLARLAAGSSGQVLTSNGAGVAPSYQTVSAGGLTLLGSTALSGLTTYTFSSISQSYKMLYLQLVNAVYNTSDTVTVNLNGIANNAGSVVYNTLVSGTAVTSQTATNWQIGQTTGSTPKMNAALYIYDYANTSQNLKQMVSWNNTAQVNGATGTTVNQNRFGVWQASSAGAFDGIVNITSLRIYTAAGQFNSGNAYLYGVS